MKIPFINAGRLDYKTYVFAAGRVGGPVSLLKSADSGKSWQQIDMSRYCGMILDVKFFSSQIGIIAAASSADVRESHALILMTKDGGKTWSERYEGTRLYELTWKASFPSRKVGYVTVQRYNPDPKASLFIVAALLITTISAQKGELPPPIKYKEMTLKNGLRVLMHEDKSTPIVAVNLWYHVGSKNESPGRTGFAHLFEHMMFQGSKNFVDGWRGVDELGGNVNGTTNEDRTYYYEFVPSNYLERALYLEADWMGKLLDAVSQEKLDNQRDVVKNERRQRIDNVPYGTTGERISELMYPENHRITGR